jgi:Fic family protein
MREAEFTDSAPGRVVQLARGRGGHIAFVPNALPPALQWGPLEVGLLSAADRALGRLAGVGQTLPNPHLLIGPFKRREAVLSSRIEGTQASLDDLLLFEASPTTPPRVPDVLEVANYVNALEHGLARQATLPMSNRLIREMHAILLKDVRGQERTPGQFRRSQNWIGSPGSPIDEASYVPPPPSELGQLLEAFEQFLHRPSDLPPLVRLALVHYQFEAIHPFLDGNGRIGRLLITLLLCMEGILPGPLLYLSAYFERHRAEYYRHLLRVSQCGAWSEWIAFFLRGVAEQAMDAVDRADRLLRLRERYHAYFHAARSSALLLKLIDELFSAPSITMRRARSLLGISDGAASRHIRTLEEAGILVEVTGKTRGRVYFAAEILRVTGEQQLASYRPTYDSSGDSQDEDTSDR